MSDFSRRTFLAGTATAAAVASGTTSYAGASDGSPSGARRTRTSIYRQNIGEIELLSITDGATSFPRRQDFVTNRSPEDVAQALQQAFFPTDPITLTFTPVVLKSSGKLIVIDTGLGEAAFKQSNGIGGQFHSNLAVAGYDAGSVDRVLITHFHADHIGGLVTADGKPAFPKSEIWVPAAEYAFWMNSGNMAPDASEAMVANFERARRIFGILGDSVKKFAPEMEVAPGVTSIATHGHTPGHTSFIVTSGSDKVIIQGDVTTHPALFIRHPDWHGFTDVDPVMAEQSRRMLYDRIVAERILVHGFHFPFPSLGHLTREDDGYRLMPIMWNPAP
ncbi:MBL fold metallo-hydrolase [Nitrospirillum pindoramense]|uniref:Glyoxylase-like metal-dependent hydrolase (Beta-lactamase superfamily II) n=1 Tax=Nitrospirillum amazonense TaxID=28077 RepID=A0A560HA21_9PROT|nr:MBL fold metallo-hydrolase [Nitrospirillum amazonense]TWB43195.1 glyoxylase-like metal-dependent hydrolase (beta-lactamase superfamily II) [Nitrospirillum amazonense]